MINNIIVKQDNTRVWLTINRPECMNALNLKTLEELYFAVNKYGNNEKTRSIAIFGAGSKAFCAGNDLKERLVMTPKERFYQTMILQKLLFKIEEVPVPVIAAIKGYCLGGGLGLALACDIRVAAISSIFSFPEMRLGAFPGAGEPMRMAWLVSPAAAKEFLMSARRIKGKEAYQMGLIQRLVEDKNLETEVKKLCEQIENSTRRGISAIKKIINSMPNLNLDETFKLSKTLREPMEGTNDYEDGLKTYLKDRK